MTVETLGFLSVQAMAMRAMVVPRSSATLVNSRTLAMRCWPSGLVRRSFSHS